MLSPEHTDPPGDTAQTSAHGRGKALVLEDQASIRDIVGLHLRLEELDVTEAADGKAALELARAQKFDVIVLDVMLPGIDGITLCRAVRRDSANTLTPILILSARGEESDKVLGLESGADDYLTKPFGVRELRARVRALLRRGHSHHAEAADEGSRPLSYKDIYIDPARRQVTVEGRDVELTAQEFHLLYVLLSHPGIVFSRETLLRKIWKGDTFVTERTVDTLIKRVRTKIEKDRGNNKVILTVWSTGYKAAAV